MESDGASGPDEHAFNALFEAHYAELRRFVVRRIENRAAAEDVLAETFAIAWRRRELTPDPALPWLFGICHKVIANHRRSTKRRLRLINRLAGTRPDVGRDPADLLAERSEIGRALSRLSAAQREVLRLVAWDGLGATEAAAVLDCTPAAFRVRLHRARTELAKHLAEAGHGPGKATSTAEPQEGLQGTR
jgi:RNA polymerase sigma-70 factor (ECF subfamily)